MPIESWAVFRHDGKGWIKATKEELLSFSLVKIAKSHYAIRINETYLFTSENAEKQLVGKKTFPFSAVIDTMIDTLSRHAFKPERTWEILQLSEVLCYFNAVTILGGSFVYGKAVWARPGDEVPF